MTRLSNERMQTIREDDARIEPYELQAFPAVYSQRKDLLQHIDALVSEVDPMSVPMLMWCPSCGQRHVDEGEYAQKPHHTHACQNCGMVWRPALINTVGVRFLPGFLNPTPDETEPE